jgi:hypothetical protein
MAEASFQRRDQLQTRIHVHTCSRHRYL